MARGRRTLTPAERALWSEVARTATPLHPEPPEAPAEVPAPPIPVSTPVPPPGPPPPPRRLRPAPPERPRVTLDLAPDPSAPARPHPHMDRRSFERLRRGKLTPDARLDLHGMTSERAHSMLVGFVLDAHARGLRLLLVITGKGRPGDPGTVIPERHGILRHSLPHWLAAPPLAGKVLQIAPAHQRHGGGGAFYVYLRRTRPA
jgi:DNA-nicking Smr family endonuclease